MQFIQPVDLNLDGHLDFLGAQIKLGIQVIVAETEDGGSGQYLNQFELGLVSR